MLIPTSPLSGSGKTSMRSIIFSNYLASATSRFGATIDVEQNHVRFLGSVLLNLWDCGGQDAFLNSYLSNERSTVFQDVGVLIYVLDIASREPERDLFYYRQCLEACRKHSPQADIFVLVHKMDLVEGGKREKRDAFWKRRKEMTRWSGDSRIETFMTSIWDESLYRAWSRIVHSLIPNIPVLCSHLTTFATICSATEVVLFERHTFLIIARSGDDPTDNKADDFAEPTEQDDEEEQTQTDQPSAELNPKRFEKISELVKGFRYSCNKLDEHFNSLEIRFPNYTALLENLTAGTCVLIIVANPNVQSGALKVNVRLAREKFEQLLASFAQTNT
ncbi:hypothetical protein BOTBODRAFT_101961 [Botryobasidium botryosum FD-172 SS1]|uniref:GTP-binding protein n=1 Tax=Botryobasidium botryosum (strain FD-172 SS1) TaxID=930990 RepID=A0A067MYK1_BOTB1|nr:hypothetical protein BOTBODRAFT_101961 [Botryobasidium botryosum FD-172 SS1]